MSENHKTNGSHAKRPRLGEGSSHNTRLFVLPQGNHLVSLMTILRDSNTSVGTFAEVTERVGDHLISAGALYTSFL